jgi:hypothetical protein
MLPGVLSEEPLKQLLVEFISTIMKGLIKRSHTSLSCLPGLFRIPRIIPEFPVNTMIFRVPVGHMIGAVLFGQQALHKSRICRVNLDPPGAIARDTALQVPQDHIRLLLVAQMEGLLDVAYI